ncbi:hypothetical protein H2248_011292 [Termitomyces sp. 'cryptogamus']|nr:hypothetical protein H2248_011292 [Termitomyces sp. 'cryptogamus']
MDIEEEASIVIENIETEPEEAELTPKRTPTVTDIGNGFTSEGDQTIPDPEIMTQGAVEMLCLMQEEKERRKAARKEVARERGGLGR